MIHATINFSKSFYSYHLYIQTWSEGPLEEDKLEYFEEHNFLDCPLDSINYQTKLHFLIDLEEHEHIRMLCK